MEDSAGEPPQVEGFGLLLQNQVKNSVPLQRAPTQMYGRAVISSPKLGVDPDPDRAALSIDERSTTPLSGHGDSSRSSLFSEGPDVSCESLRSQNVVDSPMLASSILKSRLREKLGAGLSKSSSVKDVDCKPLQYSQYPLQKSQPPQAATDQRFHSENSKQNSSATYPYPHHSVIQFGGSGGAKQGDPSPIVESASQWSSASPREPFSKLMNSETCPVPESVGSSNLDYGMPHQFHSLNHHSAGFLDQQQKPLPYPNSQNFPHSYPGYGNDLNHQPRQYAGSCSAQQNQHPSSTSIPLQFSSPPEQQFSGFQEGEESAHGVQQKYRSQQAASATSGSQMSNIPNSYHNSAFLQTENCKLGNSQTPLLSPTPGYLSGSSLTPEDQESPLVNFTKLMYSE